MSSEFKGPDHSSSSEELLPDVTREAESLTLGKSDESDDLILAQPTQDFSVGDLIGRYEFVSVLGRGGFGQVVEARDHRLNRQVAIKIPRLDKFEDHALAFFEEARSVARLDHRSIIRVYNVEQTDEGWPFVVMEYVQGPTLAQKLRDEGLTYSQAVRYFIQLAEALAYAHDQTLIHRDIKPANVILSAKDDTAKLADFGMALHDLTPEENLADCPQGTPPYMSPEQLRGENHRLDRRTDIWGFGVLMYVVLTGQKPFQGTDLGTLVREICRNDPLDPVEVNRAVPLELSRICLRCIEKLMRDRYQTTQHLVEDLKAFQQRLLSDEQDSFSSTKIVPVDSDGPSPVSPQKNGLSKNETGYRGVSETLAGFRVVPKGLRSFDNQDTDFFLELLPGPKDRQGIPDSIRFWINQIDPDSVTPLSVGMIYGPSGCGKSSFVKAGLIPHLDASVRTIYLEASPDNTESELLTKIKEVAPNVVRDETRLSVVLSRIRRGQLMTGEKLLIVLDQFEQWLSVQGEVAKQPLVESLRQCDGVNLSCLLLIRDDFWMSASQFMNRLDLRVQEGANALGIPLFDRKHARKVLSGYGRALEALPAHGKPLEANQKKFIDASIDQMADDGKVVPIHVAMFAQMVDSESWQLSELKKQGGWQGIGTRFLNKIFSDKRLSNSEEICRELLAKLLPDSVSQIKGAEKSLSQLIPEDASENMRTRLMRVLDLLDLEFRIITPSESDESERHYKLAHDSLVAPIRTWLAQQQAQTWQGRSRARVKPLVSRWNERPENRFLPSLFEFVPIKLGVKRSALTENETRYLSAATRYYSWRGLALVSMLALLLFSTAYLWNVATLNRAKEHYQSFLRAPAAEVGLRLQMLDQYSDRQRASLVGSLGDDETSDRGQLYQLFAQAHFSKSTDDFPLEELTDAIRNVEPEQSQNIIRALASQKHGQDFHAEIDERLEAAYRAATSDSRKIRIAIVAFHLGNPKPIDEVVQLRDDPELREKFIEMYPELHGPLVDAISQIEQPLNPEMASAFCKSLGKIRRSQFSEIQYQRFVKGLIERYRHSLLPIVHSAAEWALVTLEEPLPAIEGTHPKSKWFVDSLTNGSRLTFAYVPPQQVYVGQSEKGPKKEELEKGFYVATKEVDVPLFFKYLNSKKAYSIVPCGVGIGLQVIPSETHIYFSDHPLRAVVDNDLAMYQVTWNDAVGFCNWLSVLEGMEPRYRFDRESGFWKLVPQGDGYRMPSILEFDALNSGGACTKYFFGATIERLPSYACAGAIELPFDDVYVGYRGRRMPNNLGVFDSTGNAAEWCSSEKTPGRFAYLRGGWARDDVVNFESTRAMERPIDSRYGTGIRLVLDKNPMR